MTRLSSLLLFFSVSLLCRAQYHVIGNRQHAFPRTVPAGDYSGITWLGGSRYAVVSDKPDEDGFFEFDIRIDSLSGEITSARSLSFHSSGYPARDNEDIAFVPQTGRIWMTGETDNRIREYTIDGLRTGRMLPPTPHHLRLRGNLGLEALSYNRHTGMMWTCNEADTIYIQSYDSLLTPAHTYIYHLDPPVSNSRKALHYAHGIGAICALDDGSLLVLEREFHVPRIKIGASVLCKLFLFTPGQEGKQLLLQWRTRLSLFGRRLANYEGMCLGPVLADGSQVIVLVADSQHRYGGVLKDWLKTLRLVRRQP